MKKKYTFIDLFAGLGGFHSALQQLGCECVFASELKVDLQQLYQINHPGTKIYGDITQISPSEIPAHDILCAGFPCQPFSQAGKRQGFNDDEINDFNMQIRNENIVNMFVTPKDIDEAIKNISRIIAESINEF